MPYSYKKDEFENSQGDYALIPIGEHFVTCEEAEEKFSGAGNEMMELTFKVLDGGGLLWFYVVYNQYAASNFGRMMESCGLDPQLDRAISPEIFVGKTFKIMVKHEHSEKYGDQAKIHYFVAKKDGEEAPVQELETEITGSETPPSDDTPY